MVAFGIARQPWKAAIATYIWCLKYVHSVYMMCPGRDKGANALGSPGGG